jgi:mannitol-specific phosphotransferase system IIBC component
LGGSGGQVTIYYGERGSIMHTLKVLSQMDQIVGGHATLFMCTLFMGACLGFSVKTKLIVAILKVMATFCPDFE